MKFITQSEVRLGNCLEILPEYYGAQADLILTSPPYFNQRECAASGKYGEYTSIREYFDDMERICWALWEIAKPGAIFAINIGSDPDYDLPSWWSMMMEQKMGLKYIDRIAWLKGSGNVVRGFHIESHHKYYPFLAWEPVYIYHKNKSGTMEFPTFEDRFTDTISSLLRTNVWEIPQDNEAPWHPAPYPRKLAKNLIMCYSSANSIILDPFGGAMTTAVATQEIGGGRKYLCCELNLEFYERGQKRISSDSIQEGLF